MPRRRFKDLLPLSLPISAPTNGTATIHQKVVEITPPPFTCQIRVIRSRDKAHRPRRARIEITRIVRPFLEFVCSQVVLVVDDGVVCRLDMALKPRMRLEVEVEVESIIRRWLE